MIQSQKLAYIHITLYHHRYHLINTAACLVQLGEHLSAEWRVAGSNSSRTNTQGL